MKTFITKAAASAGAVALALGMLLGASAPASAATDIDDAAWARVGPIAPWTTVSGCGGSELNLTGAYCVPSPGGGATSGYNVSAWKQGATSLGGAVADGEYQGGPFGFAAVTSTVERSTSRSVTLPLTQRFPEYNLTDEWAIQPDGDDYAPTTAGPVSTSMGEGGGFQARFRDDRNRAIPATLTAVPGGVRADLGDYVNQPDGWSWVQISFPAVGLRADGTKVKVEVIHYVINPAVTVTAQNLALTTPVNVPLDISDAMLTNAVTPMGNHVVLDEQLPGEFTRGDGGLTFLSPAATTVTAGFRGAVQVGQGWFESERATVTVTAVAEVVPEPDIVAPTVRDFAFDSPQAKGDIATGTNPAEVPVLDLTDGEDFDPAEWRLEASDAMPWRALGDRLYLFPEEESVAFETRWRWVSLTSDVMSEWAKVTAPAATIVEPPVEEEEPTKEPPVTEPPVIEPPVTEPPTEEELPAVKPQPEEKTTPTPFERVETDGGVPLGALLPGGIAVLTMLAGLGIYGRFRKV